jgi:hypothetical protein
MRLDDQRRSDNVEDRRGQRGSGGFGGDGGLRFGGRGLGLGGIVIIGLIMLFFPPARQLLPMLLGGGGGVEQSQPGVEGAPKDQAGDFMSAVLGSTEDFWTQEFARGALAHYGSSDRQYTPTRLVLFSGKTGTRCGTGTSAVGPFYCPADQRVYIDTDFFNLMKERFRASGDFAQAYVVAHEVGHHVQTLTGISDQVQQMKARSNERDGNRLQVMMELQADCLAGAWGKYFSEQRTASGQSRLEAGDFEEAMVAANAIGDDTLQRQSRGYVQPDSFTHGTSEQRKTWFNRGFTSGDPAQCDTFNARDL